MLFSQNEVMGINGDNTIICEEFHRKYFMNIIILSLAFHTEKKYVTNYPNDLPQGVIQQLRGQNFAVL